MSIETRLVPVLKKLPNSAQFSEEELLQHASDIELAALMAGLSEYPRAKETGLKRAKKEIETYRKLCAQLAKHINGMGRTSLRAFKFDPGVSSRPQILFSQLKECLDDAEKTLSRLREPSSGNAPPEGTPVKKRANYVTAKAAKKYKKITGKKPTRAVRDGQPEGPFLDFLADVFETMGIKASPEAQAKKMLMEKRRHKSTN